MVMAAFLIAAMQPAAGDPPELPTCSLVTPRGDAIGFFIWSDETPDEIRLSATSGSAWPAGTVIGSRRDIASQLRFAIGEEDGFVLELSPQAQARQQRSATLFLRDGRRATLPVAYGFCEDARVATEPQEPAADRNAVGADIPAFDPTLWPEEDCALILNDGRRIRFNFTLTSSAQLRLESPDLWAGRPVTSGIQWMNSTNAQVGTFSRRNGPEGVQMMIVEGSQAAKLIRLQRIGEPSAPNLSGYGICGYNALTRGPAPR